MTRFDPEIHRKLFERIKAGKFTQSNISFKPVEREPFILPPELDFIGDKKPYIVYGNTFQTKKKSKKYGDGAKEHFAKKREIMLIDEYLSQYHASHVINLMDRYYRTPKAWRKYRPHITGIMYTSGKKWNEPTFYFYLNKDFHDDPECLLTTRIINPSVINSCLCFESPNIHENASNRGYVAKMFRKAVEDQVLQFRWDVDAQSGVHEIHHDKISFLDIMLGFARSILKINDRDEFEKQMRPLGKYVGGDGARFNPDIPRAVIIEETFQKYHGRRAHLIKVLKKPHRTETSEDIKFNTSLRNKINEVE